MSTVDDDRQQLLEAQDVAKRLTAEQTEGIKAALKNRIAKQFFGQSGIPPETIKGWEALELLKKHRAEVGYPLAPGGCLLLSNESVVAGCMAEMHTAIAESLRLSTDAIRLKLERTPDGLRPIADVEVPSDWILPTAKDPRQDPAEAIRSYIADVTTAAAVLFRASVTERLGYCDSRRAEACQGVRPVRV